jgi:hypothetical protein
MTLSARLAQQTGAAIVLTWGERLAWGRVIACIFLHCLSLCRLTYPRPWRKSTLRWQT